MPDDAPIQYNIAFEGAAQILIQWGQDTGWAKKYKNIIAQASRVSLIPKTGSALPVVTVCLQPDQDWIVFSRVFGRIGGASHIKYRVYCIGWKSRVNGRAISSKMWVYPDGVIEQGPEPALIDAYFERVLQGLVVTGPA